MDIKNKYNYKITPENYKYKTYLWDAELEVLLSLFVKRLIKIKPQLNYNKVTKDIIEKYIRKRTNSTVSATKLMREVYNNGE